MFQNIGLKFIALASVAAIYVLPNHTLVAQDQFSSRRRQTKPKVVRLQDSTVVATKVELKDGTQKDDAEQKRQLPAKAVGPIEVPQTSDNVAPATAIPIPTIAQVSGQESSRRSMRIASQVVEPNAKQMTRFKSTPTGTPIAMAGSPPLSTIGGDNSNSQARVKLTEQSVLQTASNDQAVKGEQKPQARIAKRLEPVRRAKPLPKLANPEQFRVSEAERKFHQDFQEKPADPAKPQIGSFNRKIPSSLGGDDQEDGPSWLDNLPRPSLAPGVRSMSMQRASYRQVTQPFQSYAASASLAMDYRTGAIGSVKMWRSPNLSHRPIYFEDENLERYGLGVSRWQPVVSGAKFFATAMFLPYHVGAQPPNECVYEMGYYRPGDCNPAYKPSRQFSRRGLFNQLLTFGLVFGTM
ncbi:MAG: hypothetical protein AAFN77_13130 [Planctomycetota bacterium]